MNNPTFDKCNKLESVQNERYCTIDATFLPMMLVYNKHRLSRNELLVLYFIIDSYNVKILKEEETSVSVSFNDLQKLLDCSDKTPKNAIRKLLKLKLIICKNINSRNGKSKYKYEPNVKLINTMLSEYLDKFPKLKELGTSTILTLYEEE
jgi:predicted transcriptional regulator